MSNPSRLLAKCLIAMGMVLGLAVPAGVFLLFTVALLGADIVNPIRIS